jgi:hypothetical protein
LKCSSCELVSGRVEVLQFWHRLWQGGFTVSVQYSRRVSLLLDHLGRQQPPPQLRGHQYVSRPLATVSGAFLMTSHTLSIQSFYLVANASRVSCFALVTTKWASSTHARLYSTREPYQHFPSDCSPCCQASKQHVRKLLSKDLLSHAGLQFIGRW